MGTGFHTSIYALKSKVLQNPVQDGLKKNSISRSEEHSDVGDNFWMLETELRSRRHFVKFHPALTLRDEGCRWPKWQNLSPTSQTCHQHIVALISTQALAAIIFTTRSTLYNGHFSLYTFKKRFSYEIHPDHFKHFDKLVEGMKRGWCAYN